MFLEKFNEFSSVFSFSLSLSLADMLSILAALFSLVLFFAGYYFKSKKSELYNISINNFDIGINETVKYSIILYFFSIILSIIVSSSLFYTYSTGKLVIFLLFLIISSSIISISCVNVCFVNTKRIKRDSNEYKMKLFSIFIIIVIAKLIIYFLLSIFLYIGGIQRDVNKYANNQFIKAEKVELSDKDREEFDKIFNILSERSEASNEIQIKDRIRYFYNPDSFIESDFVGIKSNPYFEKFKEYLVETNYSDILNDIIKSMILIKSLNIYFVYLFVISFIILMVMIWYILNYAFNPKKNNRYDIIEIEGGEYVVLNNTNGIFLCVKYRIDNNGKLILLCEDYRTYNPDNYKLTEAFFKEKYIEGQKNKKSFKITAWFKNIKSGCQELFLRFRYKNWKNKNEELDK